jgi:hypothetical protein
MGRNPSLEEHFTQAKRRAAMSDDDVKKPDLKLVPEEALDEEEKEFRALRRDVPGVKGASDAGILTISVGKQISPKNEY